MNFRCPLQHELLTGVVKWPQWSLAGFPRSSPGPSLRPCLPDFLCTWLPVSFSQWEDWSVGRRDKPSVSVSRCCFKRWPHTYWLNDVFITFQFWRSKVWNKSYGAKIKKEGCPPSGCSRGSCFLSSSCHLPGLWPHHSHLSFGGHIAFSDSDPRLLLMRILVMTLVHLSNLAYPLLSEEPFLLTAAKSLLSCKVTHLQFLAMRMWTYLEEGVALSFLAHQGTSPHPHSWWPGPLPSSKAPALLILMAWGWHWLPAAADLWVPPCPQAGQSVSFVPCVTNSWHPIHLVWNTKSCLLSSWLVSD